MKRLKNEADYLSSEEHDDPNARNPVPCRRIIDSDSDEESSSYEGEILSKRRERMRTTQESVDDEGSPEEDWPVAIIAGSETIKITVDRSKSDLIRSDELLSKLSLSPWDWLIFPRRAAITHTGGQIVRADDTFTKLDIRANEHLLLFKLTPDNICDRLAYTQIPEAERQKNRAEIHKRLLLISNLGPNEITETQVTQLLGLYDTLFFHGRLNRVLGQSEKGISVNALNSYQSRSGYKRAKTVATCSCGMKIAVINIDAPLIAEFFTGASISKTIGGITCQDAVAYMQVAFEHELTHAIIGLFCRSLANMGTLGDWGGINDGVAHGRTFMSIINKTFGHVDFVGVRDAAHTDDRDLKFVLRELETNKKLKHIPTNGQFAGEPILGYIRCLTNGIKFYVDKSNFYYKVKFQHVPYNKLKVEKSEDGEITSIDVGKLKKG